MLISKRDLTAVSGFAGLRPEVLLTVIRRSYQLSQLFAMPSKEVTVKYIVRIAASATLVVVAFSLATFAQIKFFPKTADDNPVARIVLNIESWNS